METVDTADRSTKNIQGRVPLVHYEFVERAARKRGQNVNQYVSEVMVQHAARELGEPIPVEPRKVVAAIGQRLGMSEAEIKRVALEQFVAREARKLSDIGGFEATPAVVRRKSRRTGTK